MAMHFPDSYYVGIRPTPDNKDHQYPLGWPVPEGTDAASQKRKASVNSWAGTSTYDYTTKQRTTRAGTSKVIDNVPVEGFKIVDDISRSRDWFGSGRTVWRMEDPRGFEFEITSGNLGEILRLTTIEKGLVKAKCLFAREGAKNALVVENSEEYQEVAAQTSRLKSAKTVKLSNVTIGSKCLMTDNTEETYYGKFYCLVEEYDYLEDNSSGNYYRYNRYDNMRKNYSVKERYAMLSADGKIDFVSKPKIAGVLVDGTTTIDESIQIVNDNLKNVRGYRSLKAVYVNKKKFKPEDVTFHLVQTPASELFFTKRDAEDNIRWIEQIHNGLIVTDYKGAIRQLSKNSHSIWDTPAKDKEVIYFVYDSNKQHYAQNNTHNGLVRIALNRQPTAEVENVVTYSKDVAHIPNFWEQLKDNVGKVDQDSMAMNIDRFIATQTWYKVELEINGTRLPAFSKE